MTRERRGFRYALDGVRSVTGWKVDELTLDLAHCQGEVDAQQGRVDTLTSQFTAGRRRLMTQRQAQAVLDAGAERGTHLYLMQLQHSLAVESARLQALSAHCDSVRSALLEARRLADSLEQHRDSALAEYDLVLARLQYAEADDSWMQRQHGRKI